MSVETLRRILVELQPEGMPLQRDEDHPHVYWSVPKDWFPGSVLFKRDEVPELLRQLRRVPSGAGRRRLLDLLIARLPGVEAPSPNILTAQPGPQEEQYLDVVEDSLAKVPVWMRYYTAGRVQPCREARSRRGGAGRARPERPPAPSPDAARRIRAGSRAACARARGGTQARCASHVRPWTRDRALDATGASAERLSAKGPTRGAHENQSEGQHRKCEARPDPRGEMHPSVLRRL